MSKKRKNQSGITLIEILVAMMIFGLIVGGVVWFGVRALESHTKSQAMQNALENARFAMESLSKRARTSGSIKQANDQEVFFIDNASGESYCYELIGNALTLKKGDDEQVDCNDITNTPADVVGGSGNPDIEITGSFEVRESVPNSSRGILRTKLKIDYVGNIGVQSKSSQTIQSTVSLRDY